MTGPRAGGLAGVFDVMLLVLLILAGAAVGLLAVGFVYQRFWGIALPVAALLAGVVNTVLLRLAGEAVTGWRFAPLGAFLAVLVIATFPGPGGNVVLGADWRVLLLLVLGAGIPVWTARSRVPRPIRSHG